MTPEFTQQIARENKFKSVSELPMGQIVEIDRTQILIPECCREGWPTCPHIPKKQRKAKRNIGL